MRSASDFLIIQLSNSRNRIHTFTVEKGSGRQHLKIFMQKSQKNIQNVCFDIKI